VPVRRLAWLPPPHGLIADPHDQGANVSQVEIARHRDFEALPPGVDQLVLALLGASAGDLLGRNVRLDPRSICEGARPLRPLALALKILSTMLRVSPRGRPSHSAETRRLARHFALLVRVAYDQSPRSTGEGP
jgi:hypothetical protein